MLSALSNFQDLLGDWISTDMGRALEELDLLTITLTRANITLALNRVIAAQIKKKNISPSRTGRFSEEGIKKAVNSKWTTIAEDARKVFGYNAVEQPRGKIVITAWMGAVTKTGNLPYSLRDVSKTDPFPRGGIAQFKKTFGRILREAGVDVNAFTHRDDRGKTTTGDDAFGQSFSTSHMEGSTLGQRSAQHMLHKLSGNRQGAKESKREHLSEGDLHTAAEWAGKEKFYDLAMTKMRDVLPMSVYIQMHKGKTEKFLGSLVPGSMVIDLEFDEIEAQKKAGAKKNVDVAPLRSQFQEWAKGWEKRLDKEFTNPNSKINIMELRGSDSMRQAIEKIAERAMVDSIVKGSKGKFKAQKRTKKPKVSANQRTKKRSLTKGKNLKSKQVSKANRSKPKGQSKKRATAWRNRGGINPIGLKQLIMKALPEMIARKMSGPPTLQYQSGRFARSAEITDIAPMPNSIEIRYDYMQDPYRVFEPGSGSRLASRARDPRQLIGSSIREIAQLIMGDRFGLVRTKRV